MRKLMLCMMAILLTTLLSSCASNGTREKVFVPDLVFPIFPSFDSGVKNPDGTVSVSGEWLVRLAEYRIRIEETEKNYNDIKALYEGKEK